MVGSVRRSLDVAALALLMSTASLAQVTVSEPWVRGTVEGQRATGAFMTLLASSDVVLVGASSPVAGVVEIHETRMEGGVMKMRAVDRLALVSGRALLLAPGRHHVMLMGLRKPLQSGEAVTLSLTFETSDGKRNAIDIVAPVRPLGTLYGSGKH